MVSFLFSHSFWLPKNVQIRIQNTITNCRKNETSYLFNPITRFLSLRFEHIPWTHDSHIYLWLSCCKKNCGAGAPQIQQQDKRNSIEISSKERWLPNSNLQFKNYLKLRNYSFSDVT